MSKCMEIIRSSRNCRRAGFEATLITPNAPFDLYLKGNTQALTAEQAGKLQALQQAFRGDN